MTRVGFLVAGIKSFRFLAELRPLCETAFVGSYPVKGTKDDSFAAIAELCAGVSIGFRVFPNPSKMLSSGQLIPTKLLLRWRERKGDRYP